MGRLRPLGALVYLIPLLVFIAVMFVVPMVKVVELSLHRVDDFGNPLPGVSGAEYRQVLTDSYYYGSLLHSLQTAAIVTALCAALAFPVASALARRKRGLIRTVMFVIVVSPLLTSVVVRSYGWTVLLSTNGFVNRVLVDTGILSQPANLLLSYGAVLVSVTHVLLPFMIIPLTTALRGIDSSLARASRSLGAGGIRTFFRVTLPLSLPGIATGVLIVFPLAMGMYITPLLVGGSNQPLAGITIYDEITSVYNFPVAAALSLVLLAMSVLSVSVIGLGFRAWERRLYGNA
jgi:putative spermidine/putrescine transport system permease protein